MANQRSYNYPLTFKGKTVNGRILINADNGDMEWYKLGDGSPTFVSSQNEGGENKWGWTPATNQSVPNLLPLLRKDGTRLYASEAEFLQDFYTNDTAIKGLNNERVAFFRNNAPDKYKELYDAQLAGSQGLTPPETQQEAEARERAQDSADVNAAVEGRGDITPENIEVGNAKRRTDYGNYFYPNNLRSTQQDRIIFTMKYISGSKISANLGQKPVQRQFGAEEIKGSVTLPIQPSISDSSTVDWSGGRLNAVQAFGAAASLKLISSDSTKEFGENVSGIMGRIAKELRDGDYGEAFKIYFAQEAVGVQGLLSRAAGAILNPNLELLFNGPSLRPVNFSFKLSPRDSTEATQIRNIIRFFKQGMSVKTTDSEIFLKAPNVFDIRYITYDNNGVQIDHPSINRVKTCALLSCNVDYTPDGSYMTYDDPNRSMTSYQMNLQFSELDPIYDEDYNDISTNDVGF